MRLVRYVSPLCVCQVQERFLFTHNGFKFLMHLNSKMSQMNFKLFLSCYHAFIAGFRVKETYYQTFTCYKS